MRHVGSRRAGDEILLLGQHQVGAVDLEQRVAAPHRLAGRVDEQLFDPALAAFLLGTALISTEAEARCW